METKTPQKKMWTEIPVTRETRQKLAIAKAKYGFRSYDELINYLLEKVMSKELAL